MVVKGNADKNSSPTATTESGIELIEKQLLKSGNDNSRAAEEAAGTLKVQKQYNLK